MLELQSLINTGAIWSLEGSAGRGARDAIYAGLAILGPSGVRDYYGSYVPSRDEVDAGTEGSVQHANKMRAKYGLRPLRALDFDNLSPAVLELQSEYEADYAPVVQA